MLEWPQTRSNCKHLQTYVSKTLIDRTTSQILYFSTYISDNRYFIQHVAITPSIQTPQCLTESILPEHTRHEDSLCNFSHVRLLTDKFKLQNNTEIISRAITRTDKDIIPLHLNQ
ncbi:hypothetical protein AMECASPLE_037403 [Ameca splendens]|uniref:Uncharacterized protein n=1 Tax=Ameca splendens TaxID=208324 RepID=A0ABV0YJ21_9TELE